LLAVTDIHDLCHMLHVSCYNSSVICFWTVQILAVVLCHDDSIVSIVVTACGSDGSVVFSVITSFLSEHNNQETAAPILMIFSKNRQSVYAFYLVTVSSVPWPRVIETVIV